MKSIITIIPKKMLLTVNIPQSQQEQLCDIMTRHGGKALSISSDMGAQKLGYLLGFKGFEPTEEQPQTILHPMAVFSGIDGKELNILLDEMRQLGIRIDLKAICTPYNQGWTMKALEQELLSEHQYMNGGKGNE